MAKQRVMINMGEYVCRVCGSHHLQILYRASHYVSKPDGVYLYRCRKCGAVSSNDPGNIYSDAYFDSYDEFIPGTEPNRIRNDLFRERVRYFSETVGLGRMLDIGCARGDFLSDALSVGFRTYGIEISSSAAAEAVKRGHRVVNCSAEQLPFEANSFVAIHMNHVLEHLEKPLTALTSIRNALAPGGIAIIEVPNEIGMLAIRLKLLAGTVGTPVQEQIRYAPHLTYFTLKSLRHVIRAAGLKIVRERIRYYGSITPMLRTVPAQIARLYDRVTKNGELLEVTLTKPAEALAR